MADQEITQEPTQGTTGGRYLTKDYLVRNLQKFWSKIKNYITENIKDFATETYVNRAVDTAVDDKVTQTEFGTLQSAVSNKAEQSELDTLKNTVSDKADASALTALDTELTKALEGKVDKVSGKGLSTNDFNNTYKSKLDNLKDATVETSGLMSASDKVKLENLSEGAGTIQVDMELIEGSSNPVAGAPVYAALSNKVSKKDYRSPANILNTNRIVCSADSNGHIIIDFPKETSYAKITTSYGTNMYSSVEKMVIKKNGTIIFTNFNSKENATSVTMENPEGKNSNGTWIISPNKTFKFYVEELETEGWLYRPFVITITRGNAAEITQLSVAFDSVWV